MKAYHALVSGGSGGGKTTYCRESHADFEGLAIWIDHDRVGKIDGNHIQGAETVRSLADAHRSRSTTLRWVSNDPIETARNVREYAQEYSRSTGYPAQITIDEAQRALPDGADDDNPVKRMLHEDRDKRIKVQLATQDITDLDYPPVKQCRYMVFVGPISPLSDGFVRYYGLEDALADHSGDHYHYTVYKKGHREWEQVYQGVTNERYA